MLEDDSPTQSTGYKLLDNYCFFPSPLEIKLIRDVLLLKTVFGWLIYVLIFPIISFCAQECLQFEQSETTL